MTMALLFGLFDGQTNTYDKYRFRGIDDVYNALGPACAKAGLVILPRVVSHEAAEKPTQKGGVQNQVKVAVEYDFVSAEDGSMHTVVGIGEGVDQRRHAAIQRFAKIGRPVPSRGYRVQQFTCMLNDGR